jgi:drug/metabolite transporter (DMT)-like permease
LKSSLKAHLAILTANAIYGANFTVAKFVMPDYIKPFGFIFLRVFGALILFFLVSLFLKTEKIEKKDVPRFIACGIFGIALNQLLFFGGLNITTPINAGIIMTMTPILVMFIGSYLLKEKLSFQKLTGIIMGIAGAIIIITKGGKYNYSGTTALGDLFILINATSYAVYMVIVKPLMQRYSTFTVITRVFFFGFIFVFPFGWNEVTEIQWSNFTPAIWGGTVFVIVGTTFFAYLFNTYGLKELSPAIVSFYIYSQPLLAAIIAISLNKDHLDSMKIISGLLIFTGVYLVSKPTSILNKNNT